MLGDILPDDVVTASTTDASADTDLLPQEEQALGQVVAKRRAEYTAVRCCARNALRSLGIGPVPILSGQHREPIWPAGVVGSMTHCTGYYAAAVARTERYRSLGIDAEPHEPLPSGVLSLVASRREQAMVAALRDQPLQLDRVLFSAKESIYKAWFPLTGRWLGFLDVDVEFDLAQRTFTARLLVPGEVADGTPLRSFHGRFQADPTHVVTAVVVSTSRASALY